MKEEEKAFELAVKNATEKKKDFINVLKDILSEIADNIETSYISDLEWEIIKGINEIDKKTNNEESQKMYNSIIELLHEKIKPSSNENTAWDFADPFFFVAISKETVIEIIYLRKIKGYFTKEFVNKVLEGILESEQHRCSSILQKKDILIFLQSENLILK